MDFLHKKRKKMVWRQAWREADVRRQTSAPPHLTTWRQPWQLSRNVNDMGDLRVFDLVLYLRIWRQSFQPDQKHVSISVCRRTRCCSWNLGFYCRCSSVRLVILGFCIFPRNDPQMELTFIFFPTVLFSPPSPETSLPDESGKKD